MFLLTISDFTEKGKKGRKGKAKDEVAKEASSTSSQETPVKDDL